MLLTKGHGCPESRSRHSVVTEQRPVMSFAGHGQNSEEEGKEQGSKLALFSFAFTHPLIAKHLGDPFTGADWGLAA